MNSRSMIETTEKEVDIFQLLKILWRRLWIILLSMLLCGSIFLGGSLLFVAPKYTSTAMMYVNNSSISVGGSSISFSSSQLSAARSLLDVYVIILKSRTTLEAVIEKAELEGKYTYSEIRSMISSGSVNGTEIFSISATCKDKATAKLIVDTIVEILPERIAEIVDGSSVRLVDAARLPTSPSGPSYIRYGMLGVVFSFLISLIVIIIQIVHDNTVKDEEYLKDRYNLPVLALIPNADAANKDVGVYGYRSDGYRAYEKNNAAHNIQMSGGKSK